MDTGNIQNTLPVILSTTPIDALLRESKQLQAISEQLIRQSRELRTICMLTQHTYRTQHLSTAKDLRLIVMIIVEQE